MTTLGTLNLARQLVSSSVDFVQQIMAQDGCSNDLILWQHTVSDGWANIPERMDINISKGWHPVHICIHVITNLLRTETSTACTVHPRSLFHSSSAARSFALPPATLKKRKASDTSFSDSDVDVPARSQPRCRAAADNSAATNNSSTSLPLQLVSQRRTQSGRVAGVAMSSSAA
jgi:hypothetical protein